MERKLEVIPSITDAIAIGTKNVASLLLAVLLFVITAWIPYLNVGTCIAMSTLPGKLAKGEIINPMFIFDSVYRRKMGNFFLLEGFMTMMMIPAFFLGIIPAIVLSMMYSLALYIMLDCDVTPTEALRLSDKATYGFKWKIFAIELLFCIAFGIVYAIVLAIAKAINVDFITFILLIGMAVLGISCVFSLYAVIYRNLFLNAQGAAEAAE